ncbi:ATP-dependent DNA ligase, partial [Streptomyces wuyuanensis]
MLLARLADVSRQIAAEPSRTRKIEALASLFRDARPQEAGLVISYLAGRLPQGRLG